MSGTVNEFARAVRIDTIGEAPQAMTLEADRVELAALATRFGLVSIGRLAATLAVRRAGEIVHAEGMVSAHVVQACAATGVPLAGDIDTPLLLRFAPEPLAAQDEVELDADDCDTIGYAGGTIDLGEAAAETLYLALDPFSRVPDADAALKAAGVMDEADAGPFAVLKGLRDRLG